MFSLELLEFQVSMEMRLTRQGLYICWPHIGAMKVAKFIKRGLKICMPLLSSDWNQDSNNQN